MIQLVLSILALIAGAVFTLFVPGSSLELTVVALVTGLAGALGVTNWREKYDAAKSWFASKTKLGAILVGVAIILIVVLPLVVVLPAYVYTILDIVIVGGGGAALYGIFDIIQAKTATKL